MSADDDFYRRSDEDRRLQTAMDQKRIQDDADRRRTEDAALNRRILDEQDERNRRQRDELIRAEEERRIREQATTTTSSSGYDGGALDRDRERLERSRQDLDIDRIRQERETRDRNEEISSLYQLAQHNARERTQLEVDMQLRSIETTNRERNAIQSTRELTDAIRQTVERDAIDRTTVDTRLLAEQAVTLRGENDRFTRSEEFKLGDCIVQQGQAAEQAAMLKQVEVDKFTRSEEFKLGDRIVQQGQAAEQAAMLKQVENDKPVRNEDTSRPEGAATAAEASHSARPRLAGLSDAEIDHALQHAKPSGAILELVPHAWSAKTREIIGLDAADANSAHFLPQCLGRHVESYHPDHAVTILLDKDMHVQLDNGWKHDFRLMRREGQTDATVAEIYDVLVRAIDRTTMLDEPVRASIRKRLFDEIFVEHGLTAEQKLPLPYPSLGPKT